MYISQTLSRLDTPKIIRYTVLYATLIVESSFLIDLLHMQMRYVINVINRSQHVCVTVIVKYHDFIITYNIMLNYFL